GSAPWRSRLHTATSPDDPSLCTTSGSCSRRKPLGVPSPRASSGRVEYGRVGALRKIREIGFQIRGIRDELLSLFRPRPSVCCCPRLSRAAQGDEGFVRAHAVSA